MNKINKRILPVNNIFCYFSMTSNCSVLKFCWKIILKMKMISSSSLKKFSLSLYLVQRVCYQERASLLNLVFQQRGCSSDGRALAQHVRGTGIDTRHLQNTRFIFLNFWIFSLFLDCFLAYFQILKKYAIVRTLSVRPCRYYFSGG